MGFGDGIHMTIDQIYGLSYEALEVSWSRSWSTLGRDCSSANRRTNTLHVRAHIYTHGQYSVISLYNRNLFWICRMDAKTGRRRVGEWRDCILRFSFFISITRRECSTNF